MVGRAGAASPGSEGGPRKVGWAGLAWPILAWPGLGWAGLARAAGPKAEGDSRKEIWAGLGCPEGPEVPREAGGFFGGQGRPGSPGKHGERLGGLGHGEAVTSLCLLEQTHKCRDLFMSSKLGSSRLFQFELIMVWEPSVAIYAS